MNDKSPQHKSPASGLCMRCPFPGPGGCLCQAVPAHPCRLAHLLSSTGMSLRGPHTTPALTVPVVKCPFPAASIGRQPAPAHRHGCFTSSKRNREVFVGGGYEALNCVGEQSFQLLKLASLEPTAGCSSRGRRAPLPASQTPNSSLSLLGPCQGRWGPLSAISR